MATQESGEIPADDTTVPPMTEGAPCWAQGDWWETSLTLAILLALGGLLVGLTGSWMAASFIATGAVALLIIVWDRPLARLPLVALIAGIDAGGLAASGASKVIVPPVVLERGPYGSSLAIDPLQIIVIIDIVSRLRLCKKGSGPGETLKTPAPEEPSMVPR